MKAVFGDSAVELTKNEARILWCLMQKELCSRDELLEDLWTNGMYIDGDRLSVSGISAKHKIKEMVKRDQSLRLDKMRKICHNE